MICWKCEQRFGTHPFRSIMFRRVSDCSFSDNKKRIIYVCVRCSGYFDHPEEWPDVTSEVTWNLRFGSGMEVVYDIVSSWHATSAFQAEK